MTQASMDEPVKQVSACASCGARVRVGARFCDECGKPVRTAGAPATFGARYAAFLVDGTVVLLIWFASSLVLRPFVRMLPNASDPGVEIGAFTATLGAALGLVILPLIAIGYFGGTDARSRSLGKSIVGVRVRRIDLRPAGWARSFLRASVTWGPLLLIGAGNLFSLYGADAAGKTIIRIAAPFALIIWPATLIMILASKRRRGLDDVIAGTETVRD